MYSRTVTSIGTDIDCMQVPVAAEAIILKGESMSTKASSSTSLEGVELKVEAHALLLIYVPRVLAQRLYMWALICSVLSPIAGESGRWF